MGASRYQTRDLSRDLYPHYAQSLQVMVITIALRNVQNKVEIL